MVHSRVSSTKTDSGTEQPFTQGCDQINGWVMSVIQIGKVCTQHQRSSQSTRRAGTGAQDRLSEELVRSCDRWEALDEDWERALQAEERAEASLWGWGTAGNPVPRRPGEKSRFGPMAGNKAEETAMGGGQQGRLYPETLGRSRSKQGRERISSAPRFRQLRSKVLVGFQK